MNFETIFEDPKAVPRSSGRDVSKYVVAGVRVPSVTEILGLASLSDIERVKRVAGEDVVENAANRGKLVHRWTEIVDLDPDFRIEQVPEHARGYVAAYQRFVIENRFRPSLSEEVVVSEAYRFAGTVDRVGDLHGIPTTIDLKTPATTDPAWPIQAAGYAIAVAEAWGQRVARACLQLRPNGRYKLHAYTRTSDLTLFVAAAQVAHYRLANGLATLED